MKSPIIAIIPAFILGLVSFPANATVYDLDTAISKVRENCSGLESKMDHLKMMAGINTGINAVGTVAGGVALGTGIVKAQKDAKSLALTKLIAVKLGELKIDNKSTLKLEDADTSKKQEDFINALRANYEKYTEKGDFKLDEDTLYGVFSPGSGVVSFTAATTGKIDLKAEKAKVDKESKMLGNVRTGLLATNAVTQVAGAVISSQNKAKGNLKEQIDRCIAATDDLKDSMMQARIENQDTTQAKQILDACGEYRYADLSKINNLATGATVSSSIGAASAGVGTVTSAMANTDATRHGKVSTEQGLNTASNVLSGVSTATSAVSTILNGVQIATIKKVVSTAQNCEKELQ